MDLAQAKKAAFRLLSMRNYHSGVLFRKLVAKGFSKEVSEQAIEECKRLGFIKDDAFILREFHRGYGPRYLALKLQLSLPKVRELITRQMQKEQILKMVHKFKEKDQALRALQRRGFDLDIAIDVFRTQKSE